MFSLLENPVASVIMSEKENDDKEFETMPENMISIFGKVS